jgi:hypothetical protein
MPLKESPLCLPNVFLLWRINPEGTFVTVLKLLTSVSVLTSYPILTNVLVREIEDAVGCAPQKMHPKLKYLAVRTTIRLATMMASHRVLC